MGGTWVAEAEHWLAQAQAYLAGSPLVAALIALNVVLVVLCISALARGRAARRRAARVDAEHADLLLTYEKEKLWRSATASADPGLAGARTTIDG